MNATQVIARFFGKYLAMTIPSSYRKQLLKTCADCDHARRLNHLTYCGIGGLSIVDVNRNLKPHESLSGVLQPFRVDPDGVCDEWTEIPAE